MKVVHLVISDMFGAGRAAVRISNAVSAQGWDSEIYVLNAGIFGTSQIIPLSGSDKFRRIVSKFQNDQAMKRYAKDGYFHYDSYGLDFSKFRFLQEADVVHLHWINEGIYSSHFLNDIRKPVVWTLHDMWSFTGGCHYTGDCEKYKERCGACWCLGSSKEDDLSAKGQEKRIQEYKPGRLQFVGCSKWITDCANQSRVLNESGKSCVTIPNPIDTTWFHPRNQNECRELLGIQTNKKLILCGAVNLRDQRKGASLLLEALKELPAEEYLLCTYGNPKGIDLANSGFETFSFGSVYDDLHLSLIYNACDVFAAPSKQENLANTVVESLACGTPVAAFDIGGMPDMILPGINGFLAKPFDTGELAAAISDACGSELKRETIAADCRERFSMDRIGKEYTELYRSLCGSSL